MSSRSADVVGLMEELEDVLRGDARARLLDRLNPRDVTGSLGRLRAQMSRHVLRAGDDTVDLAARVRRLDQSTRADGFRVLHAWNHQTHEFTDDIVPVLMLDFLERVGAPALKDEDEDRGRVTLAVMLDYYLMHLLALCAMRAWDTAEPGATLSRLTTLVEALQGPDGSGHRFVSDAETLLIYALSQFHPEEQAYDRVIEKVGLLDEAHQVAFARVSAAVLSAHLRWGFWLMYERDAVKMRRDNVGDYPWLLNSVLVLTRALVHALEGDAPAPERAALAQSLLQGLAADPWAFTGRPPSALADHAAEYEELMGLLTDHRDVILEALEAQRPAKDRYAPLALHFNFPHNALVAIVTLALLESRPQPLPLNALFVPEYDTGTADDQESLARALMAFSRGSPDRLGYRGAMLVAYDPLSGLRSFSITTSTLKKGLAG